MRKSGQVDTACDSLDTFCQIRLLWIRDSTDPVMVAIIDEIVDLNMSIEDYDVALSYCQEYIDLRREALGAEHDATVRMAMNNIVCLRETEAYDEALEMCDEAGGGKQVLVERGLTLIKRGEGNDEEEGNKCLEAAKIA